MIEQISALLEEHSECQPRHKIKSVEVRRVTVERKAKPRLPPRRQRAIGAFLRSAGPRGFQAYDADGQPLGLFAEKQAAVEAITALNSTGDCK